MITKTITPDLETDESFILTFCGFYGEINSYTSSADEDGETLYLCTLLEGRNETIDQMFRSMKSAKLAMISEIQKRMAADLNEEVVLNFKD